MRLDRHGHGLVRGLARDGRRQHVRGAAIAVLGLEVVEAGLRHDLGDAQGLVVEDGHGQLLAGDIGFDQHLLAVGPAGLRQLLGRGIGALEHQEHPDRRALGVGLDHIGRGHHVVPRGREAVEEAAARHRDAGGGQHRLGLGLVHRQRRGQHARVGIGDAQQLQHALHAAVLAPAAVQHVQRHVGLQPGQHLGHVTAHVDRRHPASQPLQRRDAPLAGGQRHLPLGREAAVEDGDMGAGKGLGHGRLRV